MRDAVARGLAGIDEQRDLHRIHGRSHAQHFARDVVLFDDEVGRCQPGHGGAVLIDDADVQRAFTGRRTLAERRGGRREPDSGTDHESDESAPTDHALSIGQKMFVLYDLREIAWARQRVI